MNEATSVFTMDLLRPELVQGKRLLEIGSRDVCGQNGPAREFFQSLKPFEYIGVDYEDGVGVDVKLNANDIVNEFGLERFDVVVSLETLEHVSNWKYVVRNMKRVLTKEGVLLITTRSYGYPLHSYPEDHWRYELEDIVRIFSDFEILQLQRDWTGMKRFWNGTTWQAEPGENVEHPGIMLLAKKPLNYLENDISKITLYNMNSGIRQ